MEGGLEARRAMTGMLKEVMDALHFALLKAVSLASGEPARLLTFVQLQLFVEMESSREAKDVMIRIH